MDFEARRKLGKQQQLLVAAVIVGVAGVLAASSRTARVRRARIVRITSATAEIALEYTPGSRPQYVIVDVRGTPGSGSASTDGMTDDVQVLLSGAPGETPTIEVTSSSRVLGRLQTHRAQFRS